MHTPTGGHFENGRFVITNHMEAIFNPDMPWGVSHMWIACIEISIFVIGGISAWYLKKGRFTDFFIKSFKMAMVGAIVVTPLQIWLGDGSGQAVYLHQPTKLGAIEAHWETNPPGKSAPWKLLAWPDKNKQENLWEIDIPYGLSLLLTHSATGQVKGLKDFPKEDQPPVLVPYYAFRVMIAIGGFLFLIMIWTLLAWKKGDLSPGRIGTRKWLLNAWMAAIPLSYLAMEAGWVTREVGRQPWMLYGLLRTQDSATSLQASTVGASLLTFAIVYPLLFALFLLFARQIIAKGPEEEALRTLDTRGMPPAGGVHADKER
jgi:cytochrome d ubiquinol oxidase subunit I